MIIFDRFVDSPYSSLLTLTKSADKDDHASVENEIHAIKSRCEFLWHPDFVYLQLFSQPREARTIIEIRDEPHITWRETVWAFHFPFLLSDSEKVFLTNHEDYYSLEIGPGTYSVSVQVRHLTYEEMENNPNLVERYEETGMPDSDEFRPHNYRITFSRSNRLIKPMIERRPELHQVAKEILQQRGRLQEVEANRRLLYVLSSNYEPVVIENSEYDFS